MASTSTCTASAEGSASDGPVLSLINKRLRALRKKYNRILQMEETLALGKSLNKEQEEVLRSKPAVSALIDEYERLRQPLSAALHDEISRLPSPPPPPPQSDDEAAVEDVVKLLYFASLFDVKPQSEFAATMLTRTHERGCCLTYDYVTDDANTDLLGERDLDAISALGSLLTSRPASSGVSHRDALMGCIGHARLWMQNSDQAIHPGASFTYAGLRERLDKILASDYYTTTPEMKAPVDVAAAAEKYTTTCQVLVTEAIVETSADEQIEGASEDDQEKEVEYEDDAGNQLNSDQSAHIEEQPILDDVDNPAGGMTSELEHEKLDPDVEEQEQREEEIKEQQYIPRRPYPNQRGSGRGGGRRGYLNGRGGRGGRGGGYQNGRNNYDSGYGYNPRNYQNPRGRGGRPSNSSMYNNHGGGNHGGGRISRNVEMSPVS